MEKRPDSLLDQMRATGDPPADTVITALLAGGEVTQANAVLAQLVRNSGPLTGDLPPPLSKYLAETQALPPWADPDRMAHAQLLFTSQGAFFGLVLMAESLPVLYAGGKGGAQLLFSTGQLSGHFRRRASETLRFILDCMEPGGLEPEGKGIRAIQKVRLMHAAIRHYGERSPLWKDKMSAWGRAINQEELVGTLLAFSSVALDGLRRLGIEITPGDQESYLHTWKVIGHLLGIRPELLPENMADARALWKQIGKRNFMRTPEGCALAKDHLAFLEEMTKGHVMDTLPVSLMHFLMGDKVSHGFLGLPRPGILYFLVKLLRVLLFLEARFTLSSATLRELTAAMGKALMESLYVYWNQGKGAAFQIPRGLQVR